MHGFTSFLPPFGPEFAPPFESGIMLVLIPLFILVMLWTVVIKGFALWHSARGGQKIWFIALLVINTLGILEIVYLIWFRASRSGTVHTPAHEPSAQA